MARTVIIKDSEEKVIQREQWELSVGIRCPFCPGLMIWNKVENTTIYFCTRCQRIFNINRMKSITLIKQERTRILTDKPQQLTLPEPFKFE